MPNLPRDASQAVFQGLPATAPLAKTYDATISAATDITLNAATTVIEVVAIDKPVFVKFSATATAATANTLVPANTSKILFLPPGTTVVSVIEQAATANVLVVEY
jgi:hypothetical protein